MDRPTTHSRFDVRRHATTQDGRSSLAIRGWTRWIDKRGYGRDADGASWFSPVVVPLPPSLSEPTTKMDPKQRAAWHCRVAPRARAETGRRSVGRSAAIAM